jgi:hypothetical protein
MGGIVSGNSFGPASWVAGLLFVGCVAGCSSQQAAAPAAERTVPESLSSAASSSVAPESTPPTTVSPIRSGTYRVRLTQDEVIALGGDDLGMAGNWTLTVATGTFEVDCRPVSNQGEDCGNHVLSKTHPYLVEIGQLRGDGTTVWFVEDGALREKLTGCLRHIDAGTGCGPEDPYRLTWKATGKGLEFTDYVGLGDQTAPPGDAFGTWTAKPWTKIA